MPGGFLSHGYNILRNNKRKRINKFDRIEPYIGVESSSKPTYKKASKSLLNKIKSTMQEQNRLSRQKNVIIFSIVGFVTIAILYYFLFIYQV